MGSGRNGAQMVVGEKREKTGKRYVTVAAILPISCLPSWP